MPITPEMFLQILPAAIEWARDGETWIMQHGRGLQPSEEAAARRAGVLDPGRIKLAFVPRIPRPDSGVLAQANVSVGLVTDQTGGLTLNYGIFIRLDCVEDRSLLFHEFVHVAQYERLGGFEGFLPRYLDECVRLGYSNSPLEREAIQVTAARLTA